jgi:hypothetical protein
VSGYTPDMLDSPEGISNMVKAASSPSYSQLPCNSNMNF